MNKNNANIHVAAMVIREKRGEDGKQKEISIKETM